MAFQFQADQFAASLAQIPQDRFEAIQTFPPRGLIERIGAARRPAADRRPRRWYARPGGRFCAARAMILKRAISSDNGSRSSIRSSAGYFSCSSSRTSCARSSARFPLHTGCREAENPFAQAGQDLVTFHGLRIFHYRPETVAIA